MTPEKQAEILIRLDERVYKIREDQKELKDAMNSDAGFTRCQVHAKDVQTLQNSFDSLKWYKRTAIGAGIALLVKMAWDLIPFTR